MRSNKTSTHQKAQARLHPVFSDMSGSGFDANVLMCITLVIHVGIHNHRRKTRYNNGILPSGIEKLEC